MRRFGVPRRKRSTLGRKDAPFRPPRTESLRIVRRWPGRFARDTTPFEGCAGVAIANAVAETHSNLRCSDRSPDRLSLCGPLTPSTLRPCVLQLLLAVVCLLPFEHEDGTAICRDRDDQLACGPNISLSFVERGGRDAIKPSAELPTPILQKIER